MLNQNHDLLFLTWKIGWKWNDSCILNIIYTPTLHNQDFLLTPIRSNIRKSNLDNKKIKNKHSPTLISLKTMKQKYKEYKQIGEYPILHND